jgi:hypothetical protein
MMRNLILGVTGMAFAIGFADASTGAAQEAETRIDAQSRRVTPSGPQDVDTAVRVMNAYGRCVARNRPRVASDILALPIRSEEQDAAVRRLFGGDDACLGGNEGSRLNFRAPLLVGAMAEGLLVDRYANVDLRPLAEMTDETQAAAGLAPRTTSEDIALCVVRRDPETVRAIIRAQPASAQERAVIDRLVPHLGPCLPNGTTFTLGIPSLRALLAAGLFRALSVTRRGRN